MQIKNDLRPVDLAPLLDRFWALSGQKILAIERDFDPDLGAPVFTLAGKYTTRGWTEWTQGFQYGSAILQFDATGEEQFLDIGREHTVDKMATHVAHFGVHDHGFNNVSTYGNLLRLMREGKIPKDDWEKNFYELALRLSGAVQARRWTALPEGLGFIYSFNGPHSLFVDTIRTLRSLIVAYELGFPLLGENDAAISLLERAITHARTTARYAVYYGEGRDHYDLWGRTAHESIFNTNDGRYRCPNAQQGFSGFTTWTRGLAWAMTGFAEQLEYLATLPDEKLEPLGGRPAIEATFRQAASATCDFYIDHTPTDGIPYWDTGAPGLAAMGDYLQRPANPYNDFEPVDSSAAAIAAQGLLRLGLYLQGKDDQLAVKYRQAGLTVLQTLLQDPYLSTHEDHQGLILHSIYHRPNGWDYIPPGSRIPNGESSMWGDYHAREAVLYLSRLINKETYYAFYKCVK